MGAGVWVGGCAVGAGVLVGIRGRAGAVTTMAMGVGVGAGGLVGMGVDVGAGATAAGTLPAPAATLAADVNVSSLPLPLNNQINMGKRTNTPITPATNLVRLPIPDPADDTGEGRRCCCGGCDG